MTWCNGFFFFLIQGRLENYYSQRKEGTIIPLGGDNWTHVIRAKGKPSTIRLTNDTSVCDGYLEIPIPSSNWSIMVGFRPPLHQHHHHTYCIPLIKNFGQSLRRVRRRQLIPIKESVAKVSINSKKNKKSFCNWSYRVRTLIWALEGLSLKLVDFDRSSLYIPGWVNTWSLSEPPLSI